MLTVLNDPAVGGSDSIRFGPSSYGIEHAEVCISTRGFDPHRPDTYGIGVTTAGVQILHTLDAVILGGEHATNGLGLCQSAYVSRLRASYSLQTEVTGLARFADAEGLDIHLVGFSGGGASSLAFAAAYPGRLRSLAIFEPASLPAPLEPDEQSGAEATIEAMQGPPLDLAMAEFRRRHLRPGVERPAPPSGPPPDWMAKRPAGLEALMRAFQHDTHRPVCVQALPFPGLPRVRAADRRVVRRANPAAGGPSAGRLDPGLRRRPPLRRLDSQSVDAYAKTYVLGHLHDHGHGN